MQLENAQFNLFARLKFIQEDLIPENIWKRASKLTQDIDVDDTDFVALAIYLKGGLWTGDKELYNGLKIKKFRKVFNTNDLNALNF